MADFNKTCGQKRGPDKQLRTARDRFKSPKTQTALHDAILNVTGITIFDIERITAQLAERLYEFKHIEQFKDFRAEVVAWVMRQAELLARLRQILPELKTISSHVSTLLVLRLPEFTGTDEDFPAWIEATAARETQGLQALSLWINEHRDAIRAGIWEVLRDCRDLDGYIDDVADCLESQTWWYVATNTVKFLDSEKTLHKRLWKKAYWLARAWKSKRLDEIENGTRPKPVQTEGWEALESKLAYYADSGELSPRPVVLGPGDDAAFEPVHPGLADLEFYDVPCDYELEAKEV